MDNKKWGDIVKWIGKVIDSCITWDQIEVAKTLVTNFDKQISYVKKNNKLQYLSSDKLWVKIDKRKEMLIKK